MASFNRDIVELVLSTCQAGQDRAAQALGSAFNATLEMAVVEGTPFELDQIPTECTGPGLLLVLRFGAEAALVVLAESSGLLPPWCSEPGDGARNRLADLANELGSLLFPQSFSTTHSLGIHVPDLAAALERAQLGTESARVAIQVRNADRVGVLSVIWPACDADAVTRETLSESLPPNSASRPTPESIQVAAQRPSTPPRPRIKYEDLDDGIAQLPSYSRSLLKIKVPVMVTLAEAKQPVENVLSIGPGSIIHFSKPCEDTLTLEVAGQKIAVGEAVKVGDKFGLWITSMILPEERFWVLNKRSPAERVK